MTRYFRADELERLAAMRAVFLSFEGRAKPFQEESYWGEREDLELYERTFARRIGWKWDAVLSELARRGRLPSGAVLLDWGCGTGVAARRALAAGVAGVRRVHLWDHAREAAGFAAELLAKERPELELDTELPAEAPDVLLVSHVLDELGPAELSGLVALAARSGAVVWVEPGSRTSSRKLGQVRAELAATLDVLAPCTHQGTCGLLAPGREGDWCHTFARPPQVVYTEGEWAEFGRELGIDLRALPYSFVALARRGSEASATLASGPRERLLRRPRLTRGRAELSVCDADGVHELDFLQRTDKALFKAMEDTAGPAWLFDAVIEDGRIQQLERRDS